MCVEFYASIPNISGLIDINMAIRERTWLPSVQYGPHDQNL